MNQTASKWGKETAHDGSSGNKTYPSYPCEVMVKILSTKYYSRLSPVTLSGKVVDVGCGFGNNLVYFVDRGVEGYGVEHTDEMVDLARANLARLGRRAVIEHGTNDSMPFEDGAFDYLVSANAIHYQRSAQGIEAALAEFRRVTKPGGLVYICTSGPEHEIRKGSRRIAPLQWRVENYDFRTGDTMAFFDGLEDLGTACRRYFSEVELASHTERYPSGVLLDFMVAVCRR